MPVRDLTSFLPTAEDVLACDLPKLGEILLVHLNSWKGERKVWQPVGGLNRLYFIQVMEGTERGLGPARRNAPEYGAKQPAVTKRMTEAWNWLEKEGFLMPNPDQRPGDFYVITTEGERLLERLARYEKWEKIGADRVKHDLIENRWYPSVADGEEMKEAAWAWVRMKENKPPVKRTAAGDWVLIDEDRLDELRELRSSDFDFKKLIRLCEELNIASREDCHFATGMLTRAVLDHVPPLFRVRSFAEVANNYPGGSRSFRETMLHLDTAAKKIADGLLHTQIRKSETLPNAQQVNFAAPLDLLLSEIIRIHK
jgi:hypothetical protein